MRHDLRTIARDIVSNYGVHWDRIPAGLNKTQFRALLILIAKEMRAWSLSPYVPTDDSKWNEYQARTGLGAARHPQPTIACGDCFRWAVQEAQRLEPLYKTVYVVHAEVHQYDPWDKYTRSYLHAWVEYGSGWEDALCQDWQRKDLEPVPLNAYYAAMQPKRIRRYRVEEAQVLSVRHKNWGPWA